MMTHLKPKQQPTLLKLLLQVLRKLFPGTLLYHDVCALTSLPKVNVSLVPDLWHVLIQPIG